MRIRISARKSDLARLQAYQVGQALKNKHPQLDIEYQFRESLGDKNLVDPLWKIPEKGVFTEDFKQDLLSGATDMVVHSWKDLPTENNDQTYIVATLPRADQRDLLLFKKSALNQAEVKIFSSSPRREFNLSELLPQILPWKIKNLQFLSVRGNIQTRVKKLIEDPDVHGLILAKAAFDRLLSVKDEEFKKTQNFLRESLNSLNWMVLPLSENPNAAAQGALAVEIHQKREDLKKIFESINCKETYQAATAERQLLQNYGGGCHLALGMSILIEKDHKITFVRGKTPHGKLVQVNQLESPSSPPQFSAEELWSLGSKEVLREQEFNSNLDPSFGYVVSRVEAWPESMTKKASDYKIWTAGLKTWKKLAKLGVWVHGSFDSLGDSNSPQTEALWGQVPWKTLTHAGHPYLDLKQHLVTYETELPEYEIKNEKFFFWRSSSQFLHAMKKYPSLCERYHATGPGSTLRTLRQWVKADKLFVFLNESDWRQKCRKLNP